MTDSAANDELDLTGRDVGDYRVLRRLGSGGMAIVYLAEQVSLGRQIALKVLQGQFANDASYVERFQHEARAAASLVHPNIVQIYDVGQAGGIHFIAQEYVRGTNLGELLHRQRTLEPRLVLNVMRQVVSALCKAAELGIVHRDIKPENILLSHSGDVKVADFGLARIQRTGAKTLTQAGVTLGTPLYMSPEQIEGQPVDSRSDVYSLGVTCYHLIAGVPPHEGETPLAIAVKHLNVTPSTLQSVSGDVPPSLARLVHRMMEKKPADRPATPSELLQELRRLSTEAVSEGWGDGPDGWSLAEWVATAEARGESTHRLGALMQASAKLRAVPWSLGTVGALAAGAALVGIALALATRPRPYLEGNGAAAVVERENVWAQIYHAKMAPSEEAWEAVWENFPNADPYAHALAQQGLVRYYLFLRQDFAAALPPLRELSGTLTDSQTSLRAFTFAGLAIVHHRLGQLEEAREAYTQLTSELKDELQRSDSRMYDLLQSAAPDIVD